MASCSQCVTISANDLKEFTRASAHRRRMNKALANISFNETRIFHHAWQHCRRHSFDPFVLPERTQAERHRQSSR